MPPLKYFQVECSDPVGGEAYKRIAGDVLQDLDLIKVIEKLHIFIDPKVPIFAAAGVIRHLPRQVRVRDFAAVNVQEGKAVLDIGDETYLAPLLTRLWAKFGKEYVDQPDRFTVVLPAELFEAEEIEDMVVADPSQSIYQDVIYAMQYIAPEGFKVRRQYVRGTTFYYVASEDTLPEDVVETLVAGIFARMGVSL
jgi:putative methanogenesis marker protein 17